MLNQAQIIGTLGKIETRHTAAGDAVVSASVATTERWTDKASGEKREATEWHNISVFGQPANFASQYAHVGDRVFVSGKMKTRKWQDQSGQDRYTTEIAVQNFGGQFNVVHSKQQQIQQPQPAVQNKLTPQTIEPAINFDDDIPF